MIDKTLSTPAYARLTAAWAIRSADSNPIGAFYALVTAKVFTAFMFEGVVHHPGQKLSSTWDEPPGEVNKGRRPPLSHRPLYERHKAIRRLLKLDNGDIRYQDIQRVIDCLCSFRDAFAHPKVLRETIDHFAPSMLAPIPRIAWELEVDATQIKRDYQETEEYCIELLDAAAELLESAYHSECRGGPNAYAHLTNLKLEAAGLKSFLHCSAGSVY